MISMKPVPALSARSRTALLNMSISPAISARGAAAANGVTPQSGIEMSSTRPASPSANPIAVLVSEANQQCHYIERTLKVGGHDRGCEVESVPAGGSDHFRFGGRPALNSQFPHELGRPVFELSYPFTNGLRIAEGQYPNQCQGG